MAELRYCRRHPKRISLAEFIKALFITTMGIEGLQIYNACDPEDTATVNEIIKKLDEHILGQTNETFERYKFNARGQMCEEAIDAYVVALTILQKTCNFCDCLKDSLLRDRIVFGVRDNGVRKRLLHERSLHLSRCIDICRTHENTTSQMKLITDTGEEVHRVEERLHFTNKRQHGRGQFRQQKQERTTFPTQTGRLLIENSADVNMNGKRKCVQRGDKFAANATSAIISRGVALQMSVQKCMSSTNNRQTLSMKCMKIAS